MTKGRRLLTLALTLALAATSLAAASAQEVARVTLDELKTLMARGEVVVLDVLGAPPETKIKGAMHIPLDQVEARAGELPTGREIVTYCA